MLPKRLLPGIGVLLPVLLLCSSYLFSQDRAITGKITDAVEGTGLQGASVTIKGTSLGTRTNEEGVFRINVPASARVLVISSVGFGSREIDITSLTSVNLTLNPTNKALNEVIVVGYGTQRRREVTGAISKVSGEQLTTIAAPSFEASLQGKAPGVQVIQGSGLAGSG